jgi:transposase
MWKPEHRETADRRGLRYETDLTDAEWALVAPLIRPAKRGGRPRTVNVREVLNAIFYVLWTGCQWKALPKDLPPRSTVWEYLDLWDWDGTLERIHADAMMQNAHVVFLDEVFKGSSAILNALLSFMNERAFYDRGQRHRVPLQCLFAATNELPDSDELQAI